MSKNNVHPDYYKTAGRDRQDDAAAARQARSVVAKASSRERPDRMTKGPYFQRPEPAPARPGERAQKEISSRTRKAKKAGTRKAPLPSRLTPTRRKKSRTGKPATRKN